MQVVSTVWYRTYYWFMLSISLLYAGASIYISYFHHLPATQSAYALTTTALAIASLQIVYSVLFYWVIQKKSWPIATLIASMLFGVLLIYCLHDSSSITGQWIAMILWFCMMAFNGLYGLEILIGSFFISLIYVSLDYNFAFKQISHQSIELIIGSAVIAFGTYLIWKRESISSRSKQLSLLSGMLQTKQEQSEIIIQSIADGVMVYDTTGKINLINTAAAALVEWTVKDSLGIDIHSVVKFTQEDGKPLDNKIDMFSFVLNEKRSFAQTLLLVGRENKQTIVSLIISPIIVQGKTTVAGAVAVIRDVTQQHQAEKQRADFISTASHEMRTPVAAIEGYLALALNEKVSSIDSKARDYLEKAHESTEHLGKLFQDLLTSAKAEDGRLSNHPTVVELGGFLEQLADSLRFTAQKKQLALEFLFGSNNVVDASHQVGGNRVVRPLYYVYADPERLSEVITNLFDNAVKYTDQGKISIGLTGDKNVVQFYIRDTGAGIPADDIPHLFQKFYRVDSSATRTISGTGLGLFICQKIIELYNGHIWVESKLKTGSTFYINLPRLSDEKAVKLKNTEAVKVTLPSIASLASP
ncbi:MAG TPA: ATP-binding protein [Candidatus Saccharimonadales bacterium]|jgi:signal transduction histidine kinase|nr:ATP-binding protein [Candidatus Saccharimonadales bacterium]